MKRIFRDRREAGEQLAQQLLARGYATQQPLVVGIPRGGVIVAAEVARALQAPLDVVIARRLRAPLKPEIAIGAVIGGDDTRLVSDDMARITGATPEYLEEEIREQQKEAERRMRVYRGDRPLPDLHGRTVIVIDDGIATGYTFQAALKALRRRGAAHLVAAVPLAPRESLAELRSLADEVVCLASPEPFLSVGAWYGDFTQNSDEEVIALLEENIANCKLQIANCKSDRPARKGGTENTTSPDQDTLRIGTAQLTICNLQFAICNTARNVEIPIGDARLQGILAVPEGARAMVVFAHGSGSGRESPRNAFVAGVLQEAGFGTLLFDLLEEREAAEPGNRFDIDLLAARLGAATEWLRQQPEAAHLRIGYFGASTGAAAALQAAAGCPEAIFAIVSRGGRPDLAAAHLAVVAAPTLLIVGGNDGPVIGANQAARDLLCCPKELVIVPGAGHTFEEPGTLDEAARLARAWFQRCLDGSHSDAEPAARPKVTIILTREQQLELAATTGVMLGVLEIDPEALEAGELPWAHIPGLDDATPSGDDGGGAMVNG